MSPQLQATEAFLSPLFFVSREKLQPPFSPDSKKQMQTFAHQGREGIWKQGRSSQGPSVVTGQGPGSPRETHMTASLSSSAERKPHQMEGGSEEALFISERRPQSGNLQKGCPGDSDGKESAFNVGDLSSIPGLGRFPWRRAWQPTPVFLPGESHGQRSLGLQPMGSRRVGQG